MMDTVLEGPIRLPQNAQAKRAVVFLHGYGADGNDLISLAELLEPIFPDMAFFSPHAPEFTKMGVGRQWFNDNDFTFVDRPGIGDAADALEDYINAVVVGEHDIAHENIVIMSFSQGTMQSLFTAPRLRNKIAGVVGFSGALMWEDELPELNFQDVPIMLIHGEEDDVVPYIQSEHAAEKLQDNGFSDVEYHVLEGLAHGIDQRGIALAVKFIHKVLPSEHTNLIEEE